MSKNSEVEKRTNLANSESPTLGKLLDTWVNEDLKTGSLSNGTVELYQSVAMIIKRHPISSLVLTDVTSEDLQEFMDQLSFGSNKSSFNSCDGYKPSYVKIPYTVLNHAFRFAVFPKKYILYNPMQYVVIHKRSIPTDIFGAGIESDKNTRPITHDEYSKLIKYLEAHHPDAVLPVKVAYYTGLRIGEVIGLTWQDIDLSEQSLLVRRSVTYDSVRHKIQIGTTKRAKVRIVDFCDTLTGIFRDTIVKQAENEKKYGRQYHNCFYKEVREQNRIYYEYYSLDRTSEVPDDYHEIDFICRKRNGVLVRPGMIKTICWNLSNTLPGFENFHFHALRHTYTTNLLTKGAKPKDVQELLGHSSVNTTMDIYAHATRASKKTTAKLLDQTPE